MLLNRRIIVGVCGGIASYKAVELVSHLHQAGALVEVILTEHAEDFIRPLTFATMSQRPAYTDLWEASGHAAEMHIELGEKAEVLALVPATANTIAKLAHGIADNMLTAVALASRAPLLVAPAMYHTMYEHPATQANLAVLQERGACIVGPIVGRLASGAIGPGRLPETEVLLGAIRMVLGRNGDLANRHVVITAGGTQEPIDPVRYVGNHSSGKMGYALAEEARGRGARVTLISGPVALQAPYGVKLQTVQTALHMRTAVHEAIVDADVLVMSAAVADYRSATPAARKIKKGVTQQGSDDAGGLTLKLVQNPDILGELAHVSDGQLGNVRIPPHLVRVGFAAETNDIMRNAQAKLLEKQLSLLIANDVSRSDSGFGADTNKVFIFHADGPMEDLPVMSKIDVAAAIWDRIVSLLGTRE
ncbi:MAG: bifunctional phosphopantothenoylcysteine decarboxylase/phosphopantothenate--cysteine ligase CoaBC [Ktedonobacteraceae bacterium]